MGSYYKVLKEDPDRLEMEKQRVKRILNDKYKNDPEFREKRKEYSRLYRLKKKQEQNDLNNNVVS